MVVVGSSFGDEGKAKVVDTFSEGFDYVVRYQGGDNAGHSVYFEDGHRHVFRLIPSGIINTKAVIAHGVVLNPERLMGEIRDVSRFTKLKGRLFVSDRVHIICDWAIALDNLIENLKGDNRIGTTCKGIGPTYSLKALRLNLRAGDLLDRDLLRRTIGYTLRLLNPLFRENGMPTFDLDECVEKYHRLGRQIRPYFADTVSLLHRAYLHNERILFEGSQGLLLDLDMGTYPCVTSSNIAGALVSGTGLPPQAFAGGLVGVVKSYFTRVGAGAFPTELPDGETKEYIRSTGKEYGSVTGRPRRVGWLDLVCLKYSCVFSGISSIALTLVDVLNGLPEVKVCVDYLDEEGRSVGWAEADPLRVKPVYRTFPGWSEDFGTVDSYADLSKELRDFVDFVSDYLGVRVIMISYGPLRRNTLLI